MMLLVKQTGTSELSMVVDTITFWHFFIAGSVYAVLLFVHDTSAVALYFFVSLCVVHGIVGVLKLATRVKRPDDALVAQKYTHYSFPSGHTSAAFFLAVAVPLTAPYSSPALWLFFGLLAIGIAYSRLVLKVHTFFQVLVGALIGVTIPLLGAYAIVLFVGPLA